MLHPIALQIALAVLLSALSSASLAEDTDTLKVGLAAFDAFRFEKALALLAPLADKGVPESDLGQMYVNGLGVSQDYARGAQLLLPASAHRRPSF